MNSKVLPITKSAAKRSAVKRSAVKFIKSIFSLKGLALISLLAIAILSRWLPHPPNMTAVGAIGLLYGYLGLRHHTSSGALNSIYLLPIVAMFISDLYLGLHPYVLFVYGGIAFATLIGVLFRKQNAWVLIPGAMASSLGFFFVSNLGVFLLGSHYPRTALGFWECFGFALPFLKNQMAGDLLWTGGLYTVYVALMAAVKHVATDVPDKSLASPLT